MARNSEYVNPADVPRLNARLREWARGEGETVRPIAIDRVVVEDDAIDALCESVRAIAGGGTLLVVMDRTPMRRGGDDVKGLVEDRLSSIATVTVLRLPDEGALLHADMAVAERLSEEVRSYAAVMSVGSGSVTDVVKYARHLAGASGEGERLPMICFPTAASVTAFTSALAVLTVDGVKRTLPAAAPDAVICDLRTVADAPQSMTAAGFGDVLARSVAYGDWYLAHQLGMDEGFSMLPGRLLDHAEQAMIDRSEQVGAGDLAGVRVLAEGVLLAGMAMSIVNQTAPVSGWEHVISHYLDLTARSQGRAPAFHGAQVGAATLVAARAYERAWRELDLEGVRAEADLSAVRREVESHFGSLDATGRMAGEVWRDLEQKLSRWNRVTDARRRFVERKMAGAFETFLESNVRSSREVGDALRRASAPARFSDLNEPVSKEIAVEAVQRSHLIRARFTLGDLLWHGRWLTRSTALDLVEGPGQ